MGKFNANNSPAPTDLTKNPKGKTNFFFQRCNSKIGSVGRIINGISIELRPTEPIFEKCPINLELMGSSLLSRTLRTVSSAAENVETCFGTCFGMRQSVFSKKICEYLVNCAGH
jgi:hypothetical protein